MAAEVKAPSPVPLSALTGFLVSFDANPSGDFWPLTGGRHTVGRANSGDSVAIPLADATISSRHAVIEVEAAVGKVHVEDTGSTNGTFVNDEHVGFSGRRELRDGDKLRLGGFTTIVKVVARG
jgi:pSer/pThr/pTyr-binding forkhead associated (FHA) protein